MTGLEEQFISGDLLAIKYLAVAILITLVLILICLAMIHDRLYRRDNDL